MCVALPVKFWDIKQYLIRYGEEHGPHYIRTVVNPNTAQALLDPQRYKHYRGYGMYVGNTMVGYAVVHEVNSLLSLLHVAKGYRGQGLAENFVKQLGIKETIVCRENVRAIKFYQKLGIEYTFDDE